MSYRPLSMDTHIVHGIRKHHSTARDLVPPIHLTSTFKFDTHDQAANVFEGEEEGYVYSRIANPTVDLFQQKMALLEGGEAAIATSSGMSAITTFVMTYTKPGDNFIASNPLYSGTYVIFTRWLHTYNIYGKLVRPAAATEGIIESLINNNTRFLFIETPANPTLDIFDISLWASIARRHSIPLIVDNTFASPYLQQPLKLGAHFVVHSATKYIGGHGDVVGGVIVGSEDSISFIRKHYVNHFGPTMSPFNAWLFLRGIKTLAVRMERHCSNAEKIANWLSKHSRVKSVYYPGLKTHPGHFIAQKQMKKFGGIISFELKGGLGAAKSLMRKVKLCTIAVSLGDCETLIQHPASMTHSNYTKDERDLSQITDGLIRLSVGLEDPEDIIDDLNNGLS